MATTELYIVAYPASVETGALVRKQLQFVKGMGPARIERLIKTGSVYTGPDFPGVPASPERRIDINAVRADCQTFNALTEQDTPMVHSLILRFFRVFP